MVRSCRRFVGVPEAASSLKDCSSASDRCLLAGDMGTRLSLELLI